MGRVHRDDACGGNRTDLCCRQRGEVGGFQAGDLRGGEHGDTASRNGAHLRGRQRHDLTRAECQPVVGAQAGNRSGGQCSNLSGGQIRDDGGHGSVLLLVRAPGWEMRLEPAANPCLSPRYRCPGPGLEGEMRPHRTAYLRQARDCQRPTWRPVPLLGRSRIDTLVSTGISQDQGLSALSGGETACRSGRSSRMRRRQGPDWTPAASRKPRCATPAT